MSTRIGMAVGMLVALGVPASVCGQDAPPLQRSPLAERVALSGDASIGLGFRDGAVETARARLAGSSADAASDQYLLGSATLRLEADLGRRWTAALTLAHLPYDDGFLRPLSDETNWLVLREVWVDIPLGDPVLLRAGGFDYEWRLRPHGEPFFLSVAGSESFYSGLRVTPETSFVRVTADRDVSFPGGAWLRWEAAEIAQVEAVALVVREGGASSFDEALLAVYLNALASERSAFFAGLAYVPGPRSDVEVATIGLGGSGFFGPEREIEIFVEGYVQFGSLGIHVTKRAFAGQAGARWAAGGSSAEISAAYRSGDRDPGDDRDGAFQSYETGKRFLLLEDPAWGFDWDTNLVSARVRAEVPILARWTARLDAGWFRVPEDVVDPDGFPLASRKNLGVEADLSFRTELAPGAEGWLTGAWLGHSGLMEQLGAGRGAWAAVTGIDLRW